MPSRTIPGVILITFVLVFLTAWSLTAVGRPALPGPRAAVGPSAGAQAIEVALPRTSAARLGLREGDVIEVSIDPMMRGARRARVAVIWDPAEHPADVARREPRLLFHLPDLESLLVRPDLVDRIVVRLRDAGTAERFRDDVMGLGGGVDAYTADDLARHTSRTFVVISRFHRAIALITLLASGIFLTTIMTLKLTEMRREIGALRLIGVRPGTITAAVLGIAAAVAAAGTLGGVAIGFGLVWGINAYYRSLFQTTLRFAVVRPGTLLFAAALGIVLGLGAGGIAVLNLRRRAPLEQVGR